MRALLVLCLAGCATTQATVVGTIHGAHLRTPGYPLSTLDDVLDRVRPDLVLVEIRPAPFAAGEYEDGPPEMTYVTLRARARGIAVEPIDWWLESQVGAEDPEPTDPTCTALLSILDKLRVWPPTYAQANGVDQARLILRTKQERARCLDGDRRWVERQDHFHELADRAIAAHRPRRVLAFVGQEHAPQLAQHLAARGADVVAAPALRSFESRPAPDDVVAAWRDGIVRLQQKRELAPPDLRASYDGKRRLWEQAVERRGVCCVEPDGR